jgi:hypothetical protein
MTYNLIFDIGIKNFAYCLACDKNIILWNVIDITNKTLLCECIDIKKKCNKKALFYDINEKGYCATHKKKQLNHKLFKRVSSNIKYDNSFTTISNNLLKHLNELYIKLVNPYDIECKNNIYNIKKCDKINVYIENQLGITNPHSKSFSVIVYTFFKMKQFENIINDVKFISARVKTNIDFLSKYINKSSIPNLDKTKDKKKIIVLIIDEIIKKMNNNALNTINILFYQSHKKRDDLADTLSYHLYVSNIIF